MPSQPTPRTFLGWLGGGPLGKTVGRQQELYTFDNVRRAQGLVHKTRFFLIAPLTCTIPRQMRTYKYLSELSPPPPPITRQKFYLLGYSPPPNPGECCLCPTTNPPSQTDPNPSECGLGPWAQTDPHGPKSWAWGAGVGSGVGA